MIDSALTAITDLGDLALTLPLATIILLWLMHARAKGVAVWWIAAFGLCAVGTALLKVYFFACPPNQELHSPSGHTSLSTLIYGALMLVTALEARGWRTPLVLSAGTALIISIAESRIALSTHSSIEVVLGLGIGLVALGIFAWGYLQYPREPSRLRALLPAVVLTAAALHGSKVRAEEILHSLSHYLHIGPIACLW